MLRDQHGLTVSTLSTEAAAGFDSTVSAYLKYRTDAPKHLARTLAADPEFGLAQRYIAAGRRSLGRGLATFAL